MTQKIRVLVIDDSAFARKVIREVLTRDPAIEVVGIARDGLEAVEKIAELNPDVITLDLLMPDLDGLGVLRSLPSVNAPQVIIVSVSGSESDLAIEALQRGAFDLVAKPTALATDRLYELASELTAKIKAAALARRRPTPPAASGLAPASLRPSGAGRPVRLVAIGTSTGGPQALTQLFKSLPADLSTAFAVALHIPAGYTAALAARLSLISGVPIAEAVDGAEFRPGHALIAPGGSHLRVRSRAGRLYAEVSEEPRASLYHPSIDELFESAAEAAGSALVSVVLTGMGDDGTRGAGAVLARGGRVLAESQSSCVVYGMPRSVIEAGLATAEAPLNDMATLLLNHIQAPPSG